MTYCIFIYVLAVCRAAARGAVQIIRSLLPMAWRTWALLSLLICCQFPVQTCVWSLQRICKCLWSYGPLFNIKTIWISFTFRTSQSYWKFHVFILGPKVNFRYSFFFFNFPIRLGGVSYSLTPAYQVNSINSGHLITILKIDKPES